jgi:hypothetical protein
MKKLFCSLLIFSFFSIQLSPWANASTVTWKVESPSDTYNRPDLNPNYDIEDVSVAIFDNDSDWLWFYLWFANVPSANMFNDSRGSWAGIFLDSNLDGDDDFRLTTSSTTMPTDRTAVNGYIYNFATQSRTSCELKVFNNIDARSYYVAFKFQRSCIGLKGSFGVQGYSDYVSNDDKSFDYAPTSYFTVSLPGTTLPTPGIPNSPSASAGKYFDLPTTIDNSSVESQNYTKAPSDLTALSKSILPSVVTVNCANGKGTGWAASVLLSPQLSSQGFVTYIFTNHHVIESCIGSRKVTLSQSNGDTVQGDIVGWDKTNDVAGIATKTALPKLEWIGLSPQQGWWVGVIGSPLGTSNLLTTGIISSVIATEKKFTMTAAINPGNSGGPVFDMTGRVVGLATSKRLLSTGELAEGFGIAHGTPLLCSFAISCSKEPDPWNGIPKTKQGPSAEELAAIANAAVEAKAKADAEATARAKAESDTKIMSEKIALCSDFNGDLKQSRLKLSLAQTTFAKSENVLKGILALSPEAIDCNAINLTTFDGELSIQRKLLGTFQVSVESAIQNASKLESQSNSKVTITCIKGKLSKKVTALNPKCPSGYKKK